MQPLIAVTCGYEQGSDRLTLQRNYVRAAGQAGGIPLIVPVVKNESEAMGVLTRLDGLLLVGGGDLDPTWFGEEPLPGLGEVSPDRDASELYYARYALDHGLPLLGICRGCQVLAVAGGGSLYQDIATQLPGTLQHWQEAPRWHRSHRIALQQGSRVAALLGGGEVRVNSFHHQSVRTLPAGFRVTARASDGVVEAVEHGTHPFALGVQFHPEDLFDRDPLFLTLFTALVEAARRP